MSNEVLEILEKTNGLLKGHFCLTSGLHSDEYFQCAKLYQYPEYTEKIGKMLAEKLSGVEFDTVIAPAVGAIIIGYETAKQCKMLQEVLQANVWKVQNINLWYNNV